MEMKNDAATALGHKAKELLVGMQDRVKRNPDVADFAVAFRPLLQQFEKANIDNEQEERCLEKAKQRGDIAFTLVGQDLTSPATICHWIELNIETAPEAKLRNALERALAMRARMRRKRAD